MINVKCEEHSISNITNKNDFFVSLMLKHFYKHKIEDNLHISKELL